MNKNTLLQLVASRKLLEIAEVHLNKQVQKYIQRNDILLDNKQYGIAENGDLLYYADIFNNNQEYF